MIPIAQMECCTMLGIDPKTLRNWLRHAGMQFIAHPADARLKCLTPEQVQQLARLHARPLQMSPPASSGFPADHTLLTSSPGPTPVQANEVSSVSPASSLSDEAELRQAVGGLEAKVLTLQEQLTQLTFELLRERTERYEQRLSALEAFLPSQTPGSLSTLPRPFSQVEMRARSRLLPRIEYGSQGLYVLICPDVGVLSFSVDSPEWFDWLASLVSFRFRGPQGRFSAYRESLTRSWRAYRTFHGRSHKRSLGTTDLLTIAHLEQVAASFQSEMTSL
jgi:hypothetical protein